MRSWLTIGALCAASLAADPATAWWDGGHMQIAALAYDRLDPTVRAEVDALIQLNRDYSKWVDGVADSDKPRFAFSTPRLGLTTSKRRLVTPTRATLRRATTRRATSATPISCDTTGDGSLIEFRSVVDASAVRD